MSYCVLVLVCRTVLAGMRAVDVRVWVSCIGVVRAGVWYVRGYGASRRAWAVGTCGH